MKDIRLKNTLAAFVVKMVLWAIFLSRPFAGIASERDTLLNTVYSNPYFYNIIKDKNGAIFAGTAEGIFLIEGTKLVPYNKEEGYITLSKSGEPVVDLEGIKNYSERTYLYLLPFPDLKRNEYHAGTDDYFYVSSDGRIYIYNIVPYKLSYRHHSIRTISENFVGTYSGIYYKGTLQKNAIPSFTDGYIREIDSAAFICYDELLIIEQDVLRSGHIDTMQKHLHEVKNPRSVQFRDVVKSKRDGGSYYLSSLTDLMRLPTIEDTPTSVYRSLQKNGEIVLIGEYKTAIYFSDGPYVDRIRFYDQKIDTLAMLPATVLDGSVTDRNIYLLTAEGLYAMDTENGIHKLTSLSQAHTFEMISATEMVIATNNGLYSFNTVSKTLVTLIRGVEFNRKAMFLLGDLLQVGSVNGLYTINVKDLALLASKNRSSLNETHVPAYVFIGSFLAIALLGITLFLLLRARKNLEITTSQLHQLHVDLLNKEKIEQYIRENLPTASLKSIADHFDTNNSHIYKLLEPEKPGSIIQRMRVEKLVELRNAGAGIAEIADATGLSITYLRKIKNR